MSVCRLSGRAMNERKPPQRQLADSCHCPCLFWLTTRVSRGLASCFVGYSCLFLGTIKANFHIVCLCREPLGQKSLPFQSTVAFPGRLMTLRLARGYVPGIFFWATLHQSQQSDRRKQGFEDQGFESIQNAAQCEKFLLQNFKEIPRLSPPSSAKFSGYKELCSININFNIYYCSSTSVD